MRFFLELRGNGNFLKVDRPFLLLKDDLTVPNQVDQAPELIPSAHREDDRHRVGAKLGLDLLDDAVEFRADPVHLVDEGDDRNIVLLRLQPDGPGLRLHAPHRAEERNGTVEHAERTLHLHREIHVPRRVNEIDLVILPFNRRRGRGDRDAALLLLLHPVHRRFALVDLPHAVNAAGEEEDPLANGGFAPIDVGHDPDISNAFVLHERRRS